MKGLRKIKKDGYIVFIISQIEHCKIKLLNYPFHISLGQVLRIVQVLVTILLEEV